MTSTSDQVVPRVDDPRRHEMKTPDDVSAMMRLKTLGWGSKRIAAATIGPGAALRQLGDEERYVAGNAGFANASEGEDGIMRLLGDMDAAYPRTRAATEGPQAVYGVLHNWLTAGIERVELEPLRDLIAEHVVQTFPVGPGDAIFGKPVGARVLHSIRTASLEYEQHPKRLRKILRAAGLTGPETDALTHDATTFDAHATRHILERAARSITLSEAETYLNAGRAQTALLAKHGIIKSFVEFGTKARPGALNFAIVDLDDFLDRLLARAVPVASPSDGELDIPQAASRANCSGAKVVRLILDDKLGWIGRREGADKYMSVLVRLAEVKQHVHGPAIEGWTARALEDRLRTSSKVVAALIANGHLPAFRAVNPINRCPVMLVANKDVESFQAEFVSLSEMSRERGVHMVVLKKRLEADGILPALTSQIYGATFYRRADLI